MAQDIDLDDAFARDLISGVPAERDPLPKAFHNVPGDCIEIFFSDENYVAERLGSHLTLFVTRDRSPVVVGLVIKGVKTFVAKCLKENPGFIIEIKDGKILLRHLFTAVLWKDAGGPNRVKFDVKTVRQEISDLDNLEIDLELPLDCV